MFRKSYAWLLMVLFLHACSVTPSATITPTDTPIHPDPSSTPTEAPMPTENPLAGAPEGTTAKDADGHWLRPATNPDGTPLKDSHGNQVYETWLTFPSGPTGETISGWFENHIKDGTRIPILQEGGSVKEGLPMQFMVKDGINAKYLKHEPLTGAEPGGFMGTVENVLLARYKIEHPEGSGKDFWTNIWPNNFSINLTDAQGDQHTIYGDTSFTIVLVDPADIPDPDVKMGSNPSVLSVFSFDDKKHAVTIMVANTVSYDQLADKDFMDTLFYPLGFALISDNLTQEAWNNTPNQAHYGTIANMALKGEHPYFVLSDTP